RPAHRVADRAGLLRAGGRGVDVGDAEEQILRRAADTLDQLRRVAGEVTCEQLVYAARMPQRLVALGSDQRRGLPAFALAPQAVAAARAFLARRAVGARAGVQPRIGDVLVRLVVPAGEQ